MVPHKPRAYVRKFQYWSSHFWSAFMSPDSIRCFLGSQRLAFHWKAESQNRGRYFVTQPIFIHWSSWSCMSKVKNLNNVSHIIALTFIQSKIQKSIKPAILSAIIGCIHNSQSGRKIPDFWQPGRQSAVSSAAHHQTLKAWSVMIFLMNPNYYNCLSYCYYN